MEFTLEELKRIYEFANWGVQKKGLTNKDFVLQLKNLEYCWKRTL